MLKLHVILAVDRAGLVGEDGETHHGVFDVGFLRQAPGMTVLAPASCAELSNMLRWAVNDQSGPVAIRYPRGGDGNYSESAWDSKCGCAIHRRGTQGAIITYGKLVNNVMDAAQLLSQQGIEVTVVRLTRIDPLPMDAIREAIAGCGTVLIAEEACAGISEALACALPEHTVRIADLGREYVTHGSVSQLYRQHGLDAQSIAETFQGVQCHEN